MAINLFASTVPPTSRPQPRTVCVPYIQTRSINLLRVVVPCDSLLGSLHRNEAERPSCSEKHWGMSMPTESKRKLYLRSAFAALGLSAAIVLTTAPSASAFESEYWRGHVSASVGKSSAMNVTVSGGRVYANLVGAFGLDFGAAYLWSVKSGQAGPTYTAGGVAAGGAITHAPMSGAYSTCFWNKTSTTTSAELTCSRYF